MKGIKFMKGIKSILLILVMTMLASCAFYNKNISNKNGLLLVDVNYVSIAKKSDFEKYNNVEFDVSDPPKGYKLVKNCCYIKNNYRFPVAYISPEGLKTDLINCYYGMLDYEPSFPLKPNETINCDFYVWVKESLDEAEIKETIEKTDFIFSGIRVR